MTETFRIYFNEIRYIFSVLGKGRVIQLSILFVLMILRSFFETMGIGSLFPLIAIFTNREAVLTNPILCTITSVTGFNSPDELIFIVAVLFCLCNVLFYTLAILVSWWQFEMARALNLDISLRIFNAHINEDYEKSFSKNSGFTMKDINTSSTQFTQGVVLYMLFTATNFISVISILVILLFINFSSTLFLGMVLSGIFICLALFFKKRISKWGELTNHRLGEMNKILQQAFSGIKEIKILSIENHYLSMYERSAGAFLKANMKSQIVATIPPFLIWIAAMSLGIVFLLYCYVMKVDIVLLIPVLSVYFMAFLRLLPNMNQIFSSWTTVKYYWPSVNVIKNTLGICDQARKNQGLIVQTSGISFSERIKFEDICYKYPSADKCTLSNVNFEIKAGEKIAVAGKSGSGKSTLIDLIAGLIYPISGRITIDDNILERDMIKAWQKKIGYVPQKIYISDATIAENIALGIDADKMNYDKLNDIIKKVHLDKLVSGLPAGLDTPAGENGILFSGGERQRIGIARALYRDSEIIIFDEATSALDSSTENAIVNEILDIGITAVVITHRMELLDKFDRTIVVESNSIKCYNKNGKIPEDIFNEQGTKNVL